jgi:hypothetical protein
MIRSAIALSLLPVACATAPTVSPPPFEQVGVIEGFYGPPWSHQDRLDILRFMGRVGLTHYYYAPKDDPYHRTQWRTPYPDSAYRALGELVQTASTSGVTFVYSISPGDNIVYADSGDYEQLVEKLDTVIELGVRHLALMLDDVVPTLEHEADRKTFASLAEAHAALINRLAIDLSTRGVSLVVTPTTYTDAWGDRTYLRELGALVADTVPMFWTGTDVASPDITVAQAAAWSALTGRPPLVWDNFPVNDFARWRLFLGPLRDRARDLSRGVRGLIANPMNEAHASMLPLATVAIYASDPAAYDADAALEAALDTLYGAAAPLVRPFTRVYGDWAFDQNVFEPLFMPANRFAVAPIETALEELTDALGVLDSAAMSQPSLRSLHDELAPFVNRTSERLRRFLDDPSWERRGDSLTYRANRDRVRVARFDGPITVDGDVDDWPSANWRPVGDGSDVRYGATVRGDTLYIAVTVGAAARRVATGDRIATGDHVAMYIQATPDPNRRHLTPEDILLLASPNEVMLRHMPFHGFMAKYMGDNEGLTWSEFMLSTFGIPAGDAGWLAETHRHRAGWSVEVAVPLGGREVVRLSLTATSVTDSGRRTRSLAARNYPGNPSTWADIRVP